MHICQRIAMWSGPRNISTALMRSFENRDDAVVCDEPFYASYLAATGLKHPGREAILAAQPVDPRKVIAYLKGPPPPFPKEKHAEAHRVAVWYQKLMSHHIAADAPLDWLAEPEFTHVFLLRDPHAMLVSLRKVLGDVTIEQTGLPQQLRIFAAVEQQTQTAPLILDSESVLADPPKAIRALCQIVSLDFQQAMLRWPPGPRASDGVWGPHWYANVYQTTGFAAPNSITSPTPLPDSCSDLLSDCLRIYDELKTRGRDCLGTR